MPLAGQPGTPGAAGASHAALRGSDPRRGKAAAPAGFVQGNPSKAPRRSGEGRGRRHLQIASEKGCRANIPSQRRGRCSSLQPGSAQEMPAERSGAQGSALVPPSSRAGPAPTACRLLQTSPRTPHLLLFRCQNQKPSRRMRSQYGWEAKPKQSRSKPASNSARAPSPRSWMQAQAALPIPSSPRAFPRWRWVRSPSCKCLFISYGALEWRSNKKEVSTPSPNTKRVRNARFYLSLIGLFDQIKK